MALVDYDSDRAFALIRPIMIDRVDAMGEESAARAAQNAPKESGRLARSIGWVRLPEADKLILARFGTDLLYGRFKEIGTWKMPPRSYLRRTEIELMERYQQIARRGR